MSMLILVFLQLTPSTFAIFYHYALGKKSSKKASDLSLSFILGVEIFVGIIWTLIYIFIFTIFKNSTDFCTSVFFWIMFGIFVVEALAVLTLYFRKGKNTKLFISRRVASSLSSHAAKVRTRSDALALGFFSCLPELVFTLPLYIISATILLNTVFIPRGLSVILFIISSTIPLFATLGFYCSGHNLAEIQRFRVRSKSFFRFLLCACYLIIAMAIINIGII
jgi:hypothetical protein